MKGGPSLSIVVVNFDGKDRLAPLLSALEKSRHLFDELIVVDDASDDASLLFLRRGPLPILLLRQDANRGPAAGRQAALLRARHPWVLFLDNDALPDERCLDLLREAADREEGATLLCPSIRFPGPPASVQCAGAGLHPTGQMVLHGAGLESLGTPGTVPRATSLMSTAFLCRRERLLELGGFEPAFRIFYEDHDLGVRVAAAGDRIVTVPDAVVWHGQGTQGLSMRPGRAPSARRVELQARNRILFVLRNYERRTLLLLAPLLVLHEVAQGTAAFLVGRGGSWLAAWGFNLRNLGRTLRGRALVQAQRRVGDGALFQPGPLPLNPATFAGRPALVRTEVRLGRVLGALYAFVAPWLRGSRR